MIEAHEKSGAEISIATYPVDAKDATSFGILKTDENNIIKSKLYIQNCKSKKGLANAMPFFAAPLLGLEPRTL